MTDTFTDQRKAEHKMNEGYSTPSYGTPQPTKESLLLDDAMGILHRFSLEQTGWRGWLKRWYYSDEPLRHDAANLVRRAGYEIPRPEHTQMVGS